MVKSCTAEPVAGKNLDPDKKLGRFSYPYEVILCREHFDVLDAGAAWVCHGVEGVSGWQVLINDQVKDLNIFQVNNANAKITSGPSSRLDSGVLPQRRRGIVTFEAQQAGSGDSSATVELHLDAEQARNLGRKLIDFADLDEMN